MKRKLLTLHIVDSNMARGIGKSGSIEEFCRNLNAWGRNLKRCLVKRWGYDFFYACVENVRANKGSFLIIEIKNSLLKNANTIAQLDSVVLNFPENVLLILFLFPFMWRLFRFCCLCIWHFSRPGLFKMGTMCNSFNRFFLQKNKIIIK